MINYNGNLRWYLFEEYLDIYRKEGLNVDQTHFDYTKKTLEQYKKYPNFFYKFFRNIYPLFNLTQKNNKKIVFQGDMGRYNSIINTAPNTTVLGINPKSLYNFFAAKNLYYPIFDFYGDIYEGILEKNDEQMYDGLNVLKKNLMDINPNVLIVNSDALPTGRALVLVSKELGIPTVEIQHGIYQSNFLPTGRYVDYVFVWGEYFKNLYINQEIKPPSKLKVLGYPYELKTNINPPERVKTVVYLGQNLELYDDKFLQPKIDTILELKSLCDFYGFNFIYKPHPGDKLDDLKLRLPNIFFTDATIADTLKKGDVFISFNSTSLIEAALHYKICIQLKNYPLKTDDFEELGICKSFDNLKDVGRYLKEILNSRNYSKFYKGVDKEYIDTPDPENRFLELINELI